MLRGGKVLVSISYCATHHKERNPWERPPINGQLHAEWLDKTVNFWLNNTPFPVIVSAIGFPGMLNIEISDTSKERDVWWRIFSKAPILGLPNNPGHQEGAATAIRQGVECGMKLGYDFLIHTAEDIMPTDEAIYRIVRDLCDGADYAGNTWNINNDELCAAFFGCRTAAVGARFDPGTTLQYGYLERYLAHTLADRPKALYGGNIAPIYSHTHNYEEWNGWLLARSVKTV